MKRSPVPVNSIAKSLNLSPATVSRVINHPDLVNTETRTLIQKELERLGYNLEDIARKKVESKRTVILVVLPTIENPFYHGILKGIKASASSHNHEVIIYQSTITTSNVQSLFDVIRKTNTHGVICMSQRMDKELVNSISDAVPFVQCCEYNKDAKASYVSINDYLAAKNATEYIINNGYRKIAMINGPLYFNYAQERLRGFEDALKENNIHIPASYKVSLPEIAFNVGYSGACQILGSTDRPEAVFCAADVFAVATIKAASRFGIKVPDELGIVGFDNIEVASITTPGITTVNQPGYQLGFTAASTLFEIIQSPQNPVQSILLDTELVARDSIIPSRN